MLLQIKDRDCISFQPQLYTSICHASAPSVNLKRDILQLWQQKQTHKKHIATMNTSFEVNDVSELSNKVLHVVQCIKLDRKMEEQDRNHYC